MGQLAYDDYAQARKVQAQDHLGATARMISLLNKGGVLAGKVGLRRAGLM